MFLFFSFLKTVITCDDFAQPINRRFMYKKIIIVSHVQSTVDLPVSLVMIIAGLCIRRLCFCLMA